MVCRLLGIITISLVSDLVATLDWARGPVVAGNIDEKRD